MGLECSTIKSPRKRAAVWEDRGRGKCMNLEKETCRTNNTALKGDSSAGAEIARITEEYCLVAGNNDSYSSFHLREIFRSIILFYFYTIHRPNIWTIDWISSRLPPWNKNGFCCQLTTSLVSKSFSFSDISVQHQNSKKHIGAFAPFGKNKQLFIYLKSINSRFDLQDILAASRVLRIGHEKCPARNIQRAGGKRFCFYMKTGTCDERRLWNSSLSGCVESQVNC